jgi:hypothetical protein
MTTCCAAKIVVNKETLRTASIPHRNRCSRFLRKNVA